MADQDAVPARKLMSAELIAVVAMGITVLLAVFSQAAWLDGKIERLGAELRAEIGSLQAGQASLDKRLAVVESHVLGVPRVSPSESRAEPPS